MCQHFSWQFKSSESHGHIYEPPPPLVATYLSQFLRSRLLFSGSVITSDCHWEGSLCVFRLVLIDSRIWKGVRKYVLSFRTENLRLLEVFHRRRPSSLVKKLGSIK
jgi:hypothetical protein